uniref:Mapmodulin n=1 Tax=Apis cerana TaxID=7461 RepID=V9IF80_APICE
MSNEEIECPGNRIINSDTLCTNNELKPILYEQCCDLSDIDECEESSMSLSQSCLQQIEKDFAQYKFEGADVPNKVGKCIKVYTHKRRKSIDEIKNKLTDMNNIIQNPPSTDCIDLLDEPSTTDIPVTLLTSLDMESAEYIISLNTKNIQSIVGATLTEQHTLNKCKELEEIIECNAQQDSINKTEFNTQDTEISNCSKPILRRSLRLNQQEIEETINNNETIKTSTERKEHLKIKFFQIKRNYVLKENVK